MYSWRVSEGRTWLLMRALGTIFKPQDVLDLCLFVGIRAKGGTPPETHREPIHGGSSANILGNCSCIALPPASMQSCWRRSQVEYPPPRELCEIGVPICPVGNTLVKHALIH